MVDIVIKIFNEMALLGQLRVDLSALLFQPLGDVIDLIKSLVLLFHLLLMVCLHNF